MGLSDFKQYIASFQKLAFDSAPIIYYVEGHVDYQPLVDLAFNSISQKTLTGYTSTITLTEVLVYPYEISQLNLQQDYQNLLLKSKNFHTLILDEQTANRAAQLRAKYTSKNIRTPDAIQIATASTAGCDAILTNDKRWRAVKDIQVLILTDYI